MIFNSHVLDVFTTDPALFSELFYMAGWLLPFKEEYKDVFNVRAHVKDIDIVNFMRRRISKKLSLVIKDKQAGFTFKCKKISKDLSFIEDYLFSLKTDSENHFISFAKGILEAQALLLPNQKVIFDLKVDLTASILDKLQCCYTRGDSFISLDNPLDCLGIFYKKNNSSRLCKWFNHLKRSTYKCITIPVTTINEKKYVTDAGNDVTAVKLSAQLRDNVYLLETDVSVSIPDGYWGLLAPRSSMAKSGFIMTNSIGVIDSSYRGKLKIAVTKISNDAILDLPFKCAQLIIVPQVLPTYVVGDVTQDTMRGSAGYGSTNCTTEISCTSNMLNIY